MHEARLMRGVVSTVLEHMERAGGSCVTNVELVLGVSGHMSEASAREHFRLFAAGTPAEHAALTLTWLPATYQCFACMHRFSSHKRAQEVVCPRCGDLAMEMEHSDACYVRSIDIAFDDAADGAGAEGTPAAEAGLLIAP
jgi:Zn finger protein HypA/HybF involved in hydrogenase expression